MHSFPDSFPDTPVCLRGTTTASLQYHSLSILFLLLAFVLLSGLPAYGQVVDPATYEGEITADHVFDGTWTELQGPEVEELEAGQLQVGEQFHLTLPGGYEWNTGAGISASTEAATGQGGSTQLTVEYLDEESGASVLVFEVTRDSEGGAGRAGVVTFEDLQVRPTDAGHPNSGSISNEGDMLTVEDYGDLEMLPGAADQIAVQTRSDAAGQTVPGQQLDAGEELTVHANLLDQADNFIENAEGAVWSLADGSTLDETADGVSLDDANGSATFRSDSTGTAILQADYNDLETIPSGELDVVPAGADQLAIVDEPAEAVTADILADPDDADTHPSLEVLDPFGNRLTGDNTTNITVQAVDGTGELGGQTQVTVSDGLGVFTDLTYQTAETISLEFTASGLSPAASRQVTVEPAEAHEPEFQVQPSNVTIGEVIDPPVEVALVDAFGNRVEQQDVTIDLSLSQGTGSLSGNTSRDTDAQGVAVFDDLQVDETGTDKQLLAESGTLTGSEESETFRVLEAGTVSSFDIESAGGGEISSQTAGEAFDIQITPVDASGDAVESYEGDVQIGSDGELAAGQETVSFSDDEESEQHTVRFDTTGAFVLTGQDTDDEDITGESNRFDVDPGPYLLENTRVTVEPDSLEADGAQEGLITVELFDAFDNALETGGEQVEITATFGTLEAGGQQQTATDEEDSEETATVTAEDQGDGSYTAALTSPDPGEADITVQVNGEQLSDGQDEPLVFNASFHPGPVDHYRIEEYTGDAPGDPDPADSQPVGGTEETLQVGSAFDLLLTAVDANGHRVVWFDGQITLTSGSDFLDAEDDAVGEQTLTIEAQDFGHAVAEDLRLATAGEDMRIHAEDEAALAEGQSNTFNVIPGPASAAHTTITAEQPFLENSDEAETQITVQARDAWSNALQSGGDAVELQLILEGGGTPDASLDPVSGDTDENGRFTATLQATETIETVIASGELNGEAIDDQAEVNITEINEWLSSAPADNDWHDGGNWSLGQPPEPNTVIRIPEEPESGDGFPVITRLENRNISYLDIKSGARVTVSEDRELNIGHDLLGGGLLRAETGTVVTLAGNSTLRRLSLGTSEVRFTGDEDQAVSSERMLADTLIIDNTGGTVEISSEVDVNQDLDIRSGSRLQLSETSRLHVFGDLRGDGSLNAGEATVVAEGDIHVAESTFEEAELRLTGSELQVLNGINRLAGLTADNPGGVQFNEHLQVDGELTLAEGPLIVPSGRHLIFNEIDAIDGTVNMEREIREENPEAGTGGGRGWRMLAAPVQADYQSWFEGITLQGLPDSDRYEDGTEYQPNLMWYDETFEGTDNERWRAPESAENESPFGRGYFFYVFGDTDDQDEDIPSYDDELPITLAVEGLPEDPEAEFDFGITYTAEADTGWNLVGNPFTATLDWDADGNWEKINVDNTLYIWDPGEQQYRYYNGETGSLDNGLIAPFQAFWIKAEHPRDEDGELIDGEEPELRVDPAARALGSSDYHDGLFRMQGGRSGASTAAARPGDGPRREGDGPGPSSGRQADQDNEMQAVTVELRLDGQGMSTTTHFMFSSQGEMQKDRYDAYRLDPGFFTGSFLGLYSMLQDGTHTAIRHLPRHARHSIQVPIGVEGYVDRKPVEGQLELSWPDLSDLPDGWKLELRDRQTGEWVDLMEHEAYQFELDGEGEAIAASLSPAHTVSRHPQPSVTRSETLEYSAADENGGDGPRFELVARVDGPPDDEVPDEVRLEQNYPNPFTDATTIGYGLPESRNITLEVFDVLGRRVATLVDDTRSEGWHDIRWSPDRLASGVYIYRLVAEGEILVAKMTFIR